MSTLHYKVHCSDRASAISDLKANAELEKVSNEGDYKVPVPNTRQQNRGRDRGLVGKATIPL